MTPGSTTWRSFESVSVTYPDAPRPALSDLDATFEEGELVLVVGPTGSGKSTMLRATCGLVPHFSGGTLRGRVRVMGRSTEDHPPRALADVVGFVGQNPAADLRHRLGRGGARLRHGEPRLRSRP